MNELGDDCDLITRRDLLETTQSDAEEFPLKTYVINVPNVGPYVVMVRPDPEEGAKGDEGATMSRPLFPGTEGSQNSLTPDEEDSPKSAQKRIEIVPYSNLHFFKSS